LFLKKYAPSNNGSRHQIKLNSLTLSSDKCGGLNLGFNSTGGYSYVLTALGFINGF